MSRTHYRIKDRAEFPAEIHSTRRIQELLGDAAPGEYAIDIVVAGEGPNDEGSARHWGRAIKHQDGMVHLESDQPGD